MSNFAKRPRHESWRYWWEAVVALPPSRDTAAYRRLERIFKDQSRIMPRSPTRQHELMNITCETHITVALWENFALFTDAVWVESLWRKANLRAPLKSVRRCNWSYQWAEHGARGARHCDIILEYEDADGVGILVVEAKRPKEKLRPKDLDPAYYLTIPEVASYKRRSLIYLLDDNACVTEPERIRRGDQDVAFLSWTQLADVQLDETRNLAIAEPIKAFLASALYESFITRGIVPRQPPLDYLRTEAPIDETLAHGMPLGKEDWPRPLWRIDA